MVDIILVSIGILLLILSISQSIRLILINKHVSLKWPLFILTGLIIFFLFGYIAYIFLGIINGLTTIFSLLISLILFFGAIFVIIVITITLNLTTTLIKHLEEINKINNLLSEKSSLLTNKQTELIKTQELLQKRNIELEKTLNDFYTLRLDMQKNNPAETLIEENKNIIRRIDAIKKENI